MEYYSDIDITLGKQRSGDIKKDVDVEAVKNSIRNILSTIQGSRRMLPPFATNLNSFLFEPIDEITAYDIGENILEAIQIWDERVVIEDIYVVPKYDQSRYDVTLKFRIRNMKELYELDYILRKD